VTRLDHPLHQTGPALLLFWRIESLKAMLWCIQILDRMPTYFEVGEVNDTYTNLPVCKDVTPFLAQAKLCADEEIEKERAFAQILNWRCRTEMLRLQDMRPRPGDSNGPDHKFSARCTGSVC
jgi:hypothetical protein